MLSEYEALRAYAESRNVAVTGVEDLVRVARAVTEGARRLRSFSQRERRVVALLWHLGAVTAYLRRVEGRWTTWISPTPLARRIAEGELAHLAVRVARWTPMRLLLRYMAQKGGKATVDEVVSDLGKKVKEVTQRFLPVLKLAYRRLNGPVKKPYNRHVVTAVLFKLSKELGLLAGEKRGEAEMTDLAYELLEEPRIEVVKTMPREPLILLAVASVVTSSHRVYLVSPWIDPEVAEALLPVLKGRKVTVVARPTNKERYFKALETLSSYCEVLTYPKLHTKLALGTSAILTSANLTRSSLLANIETGVYYHRTPPQILAHTQEIVASATPLPLR